MDTEDRGAVAPAAAVLFELQDGATEVSDVVSHRGQADVLQDLASELQEVGVVDGPEAIIDASFLRAPRAERPCGADEGR